MAITKYIEWLFVFMILRHDCSAYNISSEVCLETPFVFALGDVGCWFTLTNAKDWLESETGMCPKKCLVKINNLKGRRTYQLTSIALSINGLREDLKTIETRCNNIFAYDRTLEIICKTDAENDISEDLCTLTKKCKDESKTCLNTGNIGVCICKAGYIGFENECFRGNLKLNDTCKHNEQCSGVFGSVCHNERCVCKRGYAPLDDSECYLSDISEDLCSPTKECEDVSKACLLTGQVGVCICKPEYIGFENECLKGNLKLNETCKRNEQCSAAFGSVCRNNRCVCRRGYVPFNDSECFLLHSGGNSGAKMQNQEVAEDNVVSVTVGSLFGGLILGIILTVLTMTIYHRIRHGKPHNKEREYPKVASFNNTTYETEIGKAQNIPAVNLTTGTNERKVVNVPPFAHSVELPMKRNAQETTKRSKLNNDVNGDVYNHLHEKEEDPNVDETYDHAHAMGESDYSILDSGKMNMEPDVSASEDNDYDVKRPVSDYSSLKKQ